MDLIYNEIGAYSNPMIGDDGRIHIIAEDILRLLKRENTYQYGLLGCIVQFIRIF